MDSKTVFALRNEAKNLEGISKLNKLTEAFNLAQRLFSTEPYDDWIQKAFAYTLIDLSKYYIANRNINQAVVYFNQLLSIDFQENDEIIENQKNFLRPKIDTNYTEVQRAEELSKNGNNKQALAIFKNLISQNRLAELHHESYGWIIYRYLKAEEMNLSLLDVKKLLWDYIKLENKRPSMLHSMILSFALNYSKNHNEFKFYNFFCSWNPDFLRTEDWDEIKKDEKTYQPLATKAIKKTFEFLKTQTSEQDLSWLIKLYEYATELFPDDEWLLREKALLHFKNNEIELAIKIYKQLVLELSNKHYVWQEFSDCFISDNSLKIGMLSKALSLENNEDFLGDIHLDLAKALIVENLLENALVELEVYKKHRVIKGWKLSPLFDELYNKVSSTKQSLKDNRELYKKYIPFAENFAYRDFDWIELVLVDKWKDEKGKDRLTFTDGKTIEFAIGKNRFEVLKKSDLGQILKFKLHKQEIKKEVENRYSRISKKIITEYKYIPLIVEKSEKQHWCILEDTFAVVDFINKEKNIIHAITADNKEVFFHQIKSEFQIGDFIKAKIYTKKVKDQDRTDLRHIQKIEKSSVISKFPNQIAIVDHVNERKQLFHYVVSSQLDGIVKYSETSIRPSEGDFINLSFAIKKDKDKKLRVRMLSIELTEEVNPDLRRDITGLLEVRYNNYNDTVGLPDFAFIDDYYVPKYLLEKYNITEDCRVNARAIYAGNKWKVTEFKKI
ncbi:MAG: DUF7017 domain-containing protein [Candidatus Kapaibacterium sp.]|jgi:hypothetical protein